MRQIDKTQFPDENEVQDAISEYLDLQETARTRRVIQQILDI